MIGFLKKEKESMASKKWKFEKNKIETTVFSDFGIKILFCGYIEKSRYDSIKFVFKIINNTGKEILLQCDGLAVNHKMIEHTMSTDIFAYSCGYAKCSITEEIESENLDECVIQCKLALCNDFLDDQRYHIDFFLDLSMEPGNVVIQDIENGFNVKETLEYKQLLDEKSELLEKYTALQEQVNRNKHKSSNKQKSRTTKS